VLFRDGVESVTIHRQAGEIHGDDCFGCRRNRRLDKIQIQIARDRIDIDESRRRADFKDHVARGHPGKRRRDHLVARTDARDTQRDFHRAGAGVENPHRPTAEILRELALQRLHVRPGGDPTGA